LKRRNLGIVVHKTHDEERIDVQIVF